jgi:hypothetical protein
VVVTPRFVNEKDVRTFERLLDAIDLGGPLSNQRCAVSNQFP